MEPKSATKRTARRDDRPEDHGQAPEFEPDAVEPGDAEEEAVVTEVDLDDMDAPFDPEFVAAESWELDALAQDDGVQDEDDEAPVDDEFDDEAEMNLLHELGIDLDAPDGESDVELEFAIAGEDPADDGVAA
jgi:hypothetical protein